MLALRLWYNLTMQEIAQLHLTEQAIVLYEQYGAPLERNHTGEYVAISRDGRLILAPTLTEALSGGVAALGPGNFIFKVGERVVGTWQ